MSEEINTQENKSNKKNTKTLGDKECTILEYASFTGLSKRLDVWMRKTYDTKEVLSAKAWADRLLKAGAISESPEILNQINSASK